MRNLEVKIDDEDAALILLVSLPNSYENFVESFVVGKDSLTLEEVKAALYILGSCVKRRQVIMRIMAVG